MDAMNKKKKKVIKKKQTRSQVSSVFVFDGPQIVYTIAIVVGIAAVLLLLYFNGIGQNTESVVVDNVEEQIAEEMVIREDCATPRGVDGVCVPEGAQQVPLVGVMVENHVDAQPLSGIADASVVYEAPVEGSIPRLLVLYPMSADVSKVGPVRSARPYYLDWISEYGDAMYMHVGGSPEALQKIGQYALFDMNEFSRGWYFWRDNARFAPHNAYTSSELWQSAAERYAPQDGVYDIESWTFAIEDSCEQECVERIDLSYGGGAYYPSWQYNRETNRYDRYEYGKADRDAGGERIAADTVVVQFVDARVIDHVGRLDIDTIGEGDAVVFRGGHAIEGRWKKNGREDRTRWLDVDGKEIALQPGQIWVQVVSQFNKAKWK